MLSRRLRARSLAALAALGLGVLAPRAARAAEDLQAFVATMSPTGTTVDLTAAGSLDWAHWGYGMTGGPFGQTTTPTTNRKIMTGAGLIGALQVLPPPSGESTYWSSSWLSSRSAPPAWRRPSGCAACDAATMWPSPAERPHHLLPRSDCPPSPRIRLRRPSPTITFTGDP